jgi:alpha/beta superfamily hydrolase
LPRRIESLFLQGPAGRLEALIEEPEDSAPEQACLVCHPHPLYGGTMHNKVAHRIARGFRRAGAVVLRFNFRGVNLSEGEHAHGVGEIEDARVALEALRGRYPDLTCSLAGFSFGSRVVSKLGCSLGEPRPRKLVAVGFSTRLGEWDYLAHCGVPKFFVQSTHDEFGPRRDLEAAFETFGGPKRLEFIEARDHFFDGALSELEDAIAAIATEP